MAEKTYRGIGVSEGIQIGKVYKYERVPHIDALADIREEEIEQAVERLHTAVKQAAADVDALIAQSVQTLGEDKIGVLKGQKSILADPTFCPEMEKLIRKKLYSPEKSVRQVTDKFALLFENMKNSYMKERAADVKDAGYRLLNILSGNSANTLSSINSPVILVADDLLPSDTVQLNKEFVLAFATEKGGKTSHTSIFARSLGIPAVVGIPGIFDAVSNGDPIILDGSQGICVVDAAMDTSLIYNKKMQAELEEKRIFEQFSQQTARTKDGSRIIIAANIGDEADAAFSLKNGAEAVGLMRTEQMYLSRHTFPDENDLFAAYRSIAEAYADRPVIIRTLDIGGDKEVSYLNIPKEQNPFLGYRAIRLCLDQKELFFTQLRAILRASVYGNIRVMFPMISGYDELIEAKSALKEAKSQLREKNIPFNYDIQTGIMIEVPSAALMADILAREVDFFSIGTNDLVQYTLAVDRGNEKVSYLYDACNPAVIRLIQHVAQAAHHQNIPVGMCGGMAGDPTVIPLLIGLGLDELSMPAGVIPRAKYIISRLDRADCQKLAQAVTQFSSAKQIHDEVDAFFTGIR